MLKTLLARARQGYRTLPYPPAASPVPPQFRGRPTIDAARCLPECNRCAEACPTDALRVDRLGPVLDLGRCLFCNDCAATCPSGVIEFTGDWKLGATDRDALMVSDDEPLPIEALSRQLRRLLGRSLRLRQVSAGGCNGCEVEVNALGNIVFDAGRFGIEFVASPRHADGVLVTGPVTQNMRTALLATYDAVAQPKLVIAAGACAISGGLYRDRPETHNGLERLLPVDLYIAGCPPHPYTILDALLRLLGKA
jgi:Ni,Fe-hydrogenase III small subunit/NAD-dependent dihydropyrimidine dehydrogenase PreA subunit